ERVGVKEAEVAPELDLGRRALPRPRLDRAAERRARAAPARPGVEVQAVELGRPRERLVAAREAEDPPVLLDREERRVGRRVAALDLAEVAVVAVQIEAHAVLAERRRDDLEQARRIIAPEGADLEAHGLPSIMPPPLAQTG